MIEIKNPCDTCNIDDRLCPLIPNGCKTYEKYQALLAYHTAVVEWGETQCTKHKHPTSTKQDWLKIKPFVYQRECPYCWKEFKGE
jgi:hypothetical protein